jgi:hypothetical protein
MWIFSWCMSFCFFRLALPSLVKKIRFWITFYSRRTAENCKKIKKILKIKFKKSQITTKRLIRCTYLLFKNYLWWPMSHTLKLLSRHYPLIPQNDHLIQQNDHLIPQKHNFFMKFWWSNNTYCDLCLTF